MIKLQIIMDGGLIQNILSDDPDWCNANLIIQIIDWDTEGCAPDELTKIKFNDGDEASPHVSVWTGEVSKTDITEIDL